MKKIIFIIALLSVFMARGQVTIQGTVQSIKKEALVGVNIYIEGSYDGASSDTLGKFNFKTNTTGKKILIASLIGFQTWKQEVDLTKDITLQIVMKENINTLDAVVISAGSFAASDKKRAAAIMKPLDIYTTPSANGDLMAALRTMPGVQSSDDDGRIIVRGGDAYETRTYIDGISAAKPYYSKVPDVPTRGRFAPSLFKGVIFNSGGYSAEYGQALSSVLILNSEDLPKKNLTSISLMSLGGGFDKVQRWKNTSLSVSGSYTNFALYPKIFNHRMDWEKPIEAIGGAISFRQKTSSTGLLKAYFTMDYGDLAYNIPYDNDKKIKLKNTGNTLYSNISFREFLGNNTLLETGISTTYDNNKTRIVGINETKDKDMDMEVRFALKHQISNGVNIKWGMNNTYANYNQDVDIQNYYSDNFKVKDNLTGGFVESEIRFSKRFAIRPGLRAEYTSILQKWNIAPRLSAAFKTGKSSQISMAWGLFHQTPQKNFLSIDKQLDFEKAWHYILGYQWGKLEERFFRLEAYHKTYQDLLTYSYQGFYTPTNIKNNGNGHATGIDVFWRDKKTIPGFEYWVTYSFVDTERKNANLTSAIVPSYVSKHNMTFVGKYWLGVINTQVGLSYNIASPRTYYDRYQPHIIQEKTPIQSDMSINFSHIFFLGDQYSVLYLSINNLLGNDNVLAYRNSLFASSSNHLTPIKRDFKRMIFLGLFINL